MRVIILFLVLLLWAVPLLAETYSWVDGQGTVNFTDDYSQIPKRYRKKARRLDSGDGQATPPSRTPDTGAAPATASPQPSTGGGSAAPADAGNDTYGGRKAGQWQQEFRTREAEVKRLERQLVDLEALIRNPVGVSGGRVLGLPQEFKDTQRQYNEALKRYNDLNDEANKAGLPAEFRK
ncbi:MAG TPA: DUF4124 domain-containing protein [Desulfuromonadaceae bacterium]